MKTKSNTVNWTPFLDNLSIRELLYDFVKGQSFEKTLSSVTKCGCIEQLAKIRHLNQQNARERARRAIRRYYFGN